MPEEDRAMAIGNMHKELGEDSMCSSRETGTRRQTDTQIGMVITILRHPVGFEVIILIHNFPAILAFSLFHIFSWHYEHSMKVVLVPSVL